MSAYRIELREKDIDVFGHVHYAEFLSFCATARGRWLADRGIERPGDHVVARIEIDYAGSAYLADGAVLVVLDVLRVGRTSVRLREQVTAPDGRGLVRVESVVVRFDPHSRVAVPWTADESAALVG